jgi:hypothetical protein
MAAEETVRKALLRDRQPPFVNAVRALIRPDTGSWGLPTRNLLLVLAVGLLLGRIGPVGTFSELSPGARYLYWGALTPLLWAQTGLILAWMRQAAWGRRLGWPLAPTLAALAGAVPTLFEVAWAEGISRVGGALTPLSMLKTYGDVCLFALALALPLDRVGGMALAPAAKPTPPASPAPGPSVEPATAPAADRPCPFLDRLPSRLGRQLLALSAEDHYLRVHTAQGDDLLLCRLSEAEAELAGFPGLRVHRSWWVARAAVTGGRRLGEKQVLTLSNGLEVPVSRTYLQAARAAGLPL